MRNKRVRYKQMIILVIFLIIIGMTILSCSYQTGNITKACVLPDTVSFGKDLLPIFNTQCSIAGCHTTADHQGDLNLEASVAYAKLLHAGSGYVDTLHPEFSILYSTLISKSSPMPPTGRLNNCDIKLIYKWITQKAKNN